MSQKYPTLRKVNYKILIEDMETNGLLGMPPPYKRYNGKRYRLVQMGGMKDCEELKEKIQNDGHQVEIENYGIGFLVYMRNKKKRK